MFAERNKRARRLSVSRLLEFSSCRNRFTLYILRARRKHVLQLWPNKSVGGNYGFFPFFSSQRENFAGRVNQVGAESRTWTIVGRDQGELMRHAKLLIRGIRIEPFLFVLLDRD